MNKLNIQKLLNDYASHYKCDFSLTNHSNFTVYTSDIDFHGDSISFEINGSEFTIQSSNNISASDLELISIACQNLIHFSEDSINIDYLLIKLLNHSIKQDELRYLSKYLEVEDKSLCFAAIQYSDELNVLLETIRNSFEDNILLTPYENLVLLIFSSHEPFDELCGNLYSMITSELMVKIKIFYSEIYSLADTEETLNAIHNIQRIASIYCPNRSVVSSKDLGISKIITLLNKEDAIQLFKDFSTGNLEDLDNEEDIKTIYSFFENNLNIAETSRQLFIHRNTLVYRLDKYQKITSLDIRRFEDATKFQLSFFIYQFYKK
ncbi:PucR family transcriptional regulator [Anaerorhabdus sp.]|uniref:PucR family transcriptional regulator n=2 Tax=Anaerorhabdus sp. TaxID=1872524 RepID=UPI002FC76A6E